MGISTQIPAHRKGSWSWQDRVSEKGQTPHQIIWKSERGSFAHTHSVPPHLLLGTPDLCLLLHVVRDRRPPRTKHLVDTPPPCRVSVFHLSLGSVSARPLSWGGASTRYICHSLTTHGSTIRVHIYARAIPRNFGHATLPACAAHNFPRA